MTIARTLLAAAALALALAGCTVAPATPAEPTPSATPTVEPALAAPAQVFDGDCDALATAAEVSAAVGREVSVTVFDGINLGGKVFAQAGGLECNWRGDDGTSVYVGVLPATAADFTDETGCDVVIDVPLPICTFAASADQLRLVGTVGVGQGDTAAQVAAGEVLSDLFVQRAVSSPTPTPVAGAWPPLSNCAQFAGAFDWYDSGFLEAYYTPAYRALRGGGLGQCSAQVAGDNSVDVAVLGGARWVESEVAAQPGTEKTDVAGLEAVYVGPLLSSGYRYIDVFDGVNWMQAFVVDPDAAMPAIVDLVTQLNG